MKLRVKIFADGSDFKTMVEMAKNPLIQGLTTNPSLMKKAGVSDYPAFAKQVLAAIKDKPISFEVFADDFAEMKRQAAEIASWGKNVYVKIPITNSEGKSAIPLIRELAQNKVSLNVTALLTTEQVMETAKALKGGAPSIASVFAGRIADTGRDPMPLMKQSLEICRASDRNIELLWASCREVFNVYQADEAGCDIITVTPDVPAKLAMSGKDLTELSLDTVKQFKKDADAAGFKL